MSRAQENRDDKVSLVEMGPRDGLQNEAATLSLVQRLELIARLAESGLQRIEVGAFVSPKKVPQMADSAALFNALPRRGRPAMAPWCPICRVCRPPLPPAPTR